ncbi:MAG TPA: hypothetical protein VEZ90_01810, partial [Blastocatellia bacterium]|nr:hypothetical protein [Blastocatellia bacterium]
IAPNRTATASGACLLILSLLASLGKLVCIAKWFAVMRYFPKNSQKSANVETTSANIQLFILT